MMRCDKNFNIEFIRSNYFLVRIEKLKNYTIFTYVIVLIVIGNEPYLQSKLESLITHHTPHTQHTNIIVSLGIPFLFNWHVFQT